MIFPLFIYTTLSFDSLEASLKPSFTYNYTSFLGRSLFYNNLMINLISAKKLVKVKSLISRRRKFKRFIFKKYNYTLGISMQPVSLKGNSITKDSAFNTINRFNIFPIARFAYNFSRSKTFNANYSGNATQPTFTQLQPVQDNSNPLSITLGNPTLKPSINHNLNLTYNNFNFISGKVLFTNLTFSTIQNQIVNNISFDNRGSQTSIPKNVNGYYNVLGFYTFSKPYKNRKYVITLNGTANYNHNINLVNNEKSIGSNWVFSQGTTFEYNIKDWFTLGTGVSYSLNDVKYKGVDNTKASSLQNTSSNAWTLSNNLEATIKKSWVIKYDFDYTLNNGLAAGVTQNLAIMNASIEKQLFNIFYLNIKLNYYELYSCDSRKAQCGQEYFV